MGLLEVLFQPIHKRGWKRQVGVWILVIEINPVLNGSYFREVNRKTMGRVPTTSWSCGKDIKKKYTCSKFFFISLFKKYNVLSWVSKEDTRLEENARTIIKIYPKMQGTPEYR